MPIYEYVCQNCGEKYEKFIRSNLTVVELKCPHCGSSQAKKAFSVFGTQASGGGAARGACGPVG